MWGLYEMFKCNGSQFRLSSGSVGVEMVKNTTSTTFNGKDPLSRIEALTKLNQCFQWSPAHLSKGSHARGWVCLEPLWLVYGHTAINYHNVCIAMLWYITSVNIMRCQGSQAEGSFCFWTWAKMNHSFLLTLPSVYCSTGSNPFWLPISVSYSRSMLVIHLIQYWSNPLSQWVHLSTKSTER